MDVGIQCLSLAAFTQWIGSFYYMQAFPAIGTLIRMIVAIFYDIRAILLVLVFALLGYANAMVILHSRDISTGFGDMPEAMLQSYKVVLLNAYEDENFLTGHSKAVGVVSDVQEAASKVGSMAKSAESGIRGAQSALHAGNTHQALGIGMACLQRLRDAGQQLFGRLCATLGRERRLPVNAELDSYTK